VAGESHYQEALRALTDTDGATEVRLEVEAVLVPEPTNPHDPNAVMVQVGGLLVGYLPRQSAVSLRTDDRRGGGPQPGRGLRGDDRGPRR